MDGYKRQRMTLKLYLTSISKVNYLKLSGEF